MSGRTRLRWIAAALAAALVCACQKSEPPSDTKPAPANGSAAKGATDSSDDSRVTDPFAAPSATATEGHAQNAPSADADARTQEQPSADADRVASPSANVESAGPAGGAEAAAIAEADAAPDAAKEADPAVLKIIDSTIRAYQEAQSYQDEGELRISYRVPGGEEQVDGTSMPVAFARPNRIAYTSANFQIVSTGTEQTTLIMPLNQFVTNPSPERFSSETLAGANVQEGVNLAVQREVPLRLRLLLDEDASEILKTMAAHTTLREDAEVEGNPCYVLYYDEPPMPSTLYIDQKTYLMRRVVYDMSEQITRLAEEGTRLESLQSVLELKGAQANTELLPERFAFTAPEGTRQVEEFELPKPRASALPPLEGKPAPDFTLTSFQGEAITLSELKGQVVLIDLWATWCGPCRVELPILESIWQQYKDKPVRFLAVSVDEKDTPQEKIEDVLKELGITFTALHDKEGMAAVPYVVREEGGAQLPVPLIVLVDKEGIVQSLSSGAPSTEEFRKEYVEELTGKIDALLEGKSLLETEEAEGTEPPADEKPAEVDSTEGEKSAADKKPDGTTDAGNQAQEGQK